MPPASARGPGARRSARNLLADYTAGLTCVEAQKRAYTNAAGSFLQRWPNPQGWARQPLARRLAAGGHLQPFLLFLMVNGHLHPGYDYLAARKLVNFWREIVGSPLEDDLLRFRQAAQGLGYTPGQSLRAASQSIGRLLIQTGRPLEQLTLADFDEFAEACRVREAASGQGWSHYHAALTCAHRVLFHLDIIDTPPPHWQGPESFEQRMAEVPARLRPAFVAYLERKTGTCKPKTVSGLATRLAHFGVFLGQIDPRLGTLADLDRQTHIEPYLNSLTTTVNSKTGELITRADQARRILAARNFLSDISEWGWKDAPGRRLIFRADIPRLAQPLPRYLPVDADRRLSQALERSEYRLAADALLLQRACGLRIGELLDLELDCVHEIPGNGAWLKVPLGKLDTERMVPLDEETLALVDRIVATRSDGRPLPHPRHRRSAQFLFTHHGRRLGQQALRAELDRSATEAGLGHLTSHQLRHTFATAMVNAGVSLQALMALLGHVSAEMSLRYGRLFDTTVRAEYQRALDLAKANIGPLPDGPKRIPVFIDSDWRQAPAIKARLAGGYCLRAPAQGACPYANICEHCPNFRTDAASITVLSAQRVDAEALAADAEARGWIDEANRHRLLITRLDALMDHTETG
jgi:integrase